MSIYVALHHVTHYRYDRPVDLGPQIIRLRPAPHSRTPVLSYSLKVTPAKHFVNWQQDPHGNWLARFVFPEKATELKIEVDLVADMTVVNPFDFFVEAYADSFPFDYPRRSRRRARALSRDRQARVALFATFLDAIPHEAPNTVDFLVELNQRLQKRDRLRHPHGAGRADAGGDAALAQPARAATPPGCCADPAPPRPRRPLRLRLPDPAQARHRSRSTARRRPSTTSPTCTPGPRSTCPAPAGSASTRPRACSPARATSRSRRRRTTARPRRSPASPASPRSTSTST